MAKPCGVRLSGESRKQVDVFRQNLFQEGFSSLICKCSQ
uniref:Proteasome activator subunit 2 n=1 Tax=Moschus moschiferus TaxID=68415 RepID=A0A8C6CQJ3_MOSMO